MQPENTSSHVSPSTSTPPLAERFGRAELGTHWLQSSRWYWTEAESEAAFREGRARDGIRVESFVPLTAEQKRLVATGQNHQPKGKCVMDGHRNQRGRELMGSMRHWEAVSEDLGEAAEHLDAAARTIALIASKQDKVSMGPEGWIREGQPRMFGQMPETLEELTRMAVEIGKTGAQVHGWTQSVRAHHDAPASAEERS